MDTAQYCYICLLNFYWQLEHLFFIFLLPCMCGPLPISLPVTMNSCMRTSCSLLLRIFFIFSTWLHPCLGCLGSALVIISAALPLNLNLRPCLPLVILWHCSLSCWIPAYLHHLFLFWIPVALQLECTLANLICINNLPVWAIQFTACTMLHKNSGEHY